MPGGPLKVIDYGFNEIADPSSWRPDEPWDISEWIWVTVGDELGGSNFQVHVCTPTSIGRFKDKQGVFLIDEYRGVDDLIIALNQFIAKIQKERTHNPIHVLARHWVWEFGPVGKMDV